MYVRMSLLANFTPQFVLDRLWRCIKLIVSTDSTSSRLFASQFGLAFLYARKTTKNYREDRPSRKSLLNKPVSDSSKRGR